MKTTFVTSPYVDYASWLAEREQPRASSYIPLGLLSLIAKLRHSNHEAQLIDVNRTLNDTPDRPLQERYEAVVDSILTTSPTLVGFMTEYYTYHHLIALARRIKARSADTIVVFGGPQASAADIATLRDFPEVDFIVRGEGEETIDELVNCLEHGGDPASVQGITFRSSGKPKRTQARPLISNLDELPIPAFDLVQIRPTDLVSIEAGRGCPFDCSFCSTNTFWHRRYRVKSASRICDEIVYLHEKYGVTNISLIHDCLTANKREVIALCDELDRRKIRVSWGCSSRTDTLDLDLARRMLSSGMTNIYFGLESGDSETQKAINKNLDIEGAFALIRELRQLGVQVTTPFMVGFPSETLMQVANTFSAIHRVLALDVYLAQIFATAPYGDTPLLKGGSEIEYTGHFLDLPMTSLERQEVDTMMRVHQEVFSGHYRYRNAEIERLVRGVDQFFPLMNEMRFTCILLCEAAGNPLYVYESWLDWLEASGPGAKLAHTPYYGTFEQFEAFLNELVTDDGAFGGLTREVYDFERTQLRALRSASAAERDVYNPHLSQRGGAVSLYRLAPRTIVKTYAFDVLSAIDDIKTGQRPIPKRSDDVIVVSIKGTRLITARVQGLGRDLLLSIAQGKSLEDILFRIELAERSAGPVNSVALRDRCSAGLNQLVEAGLISEHVSQ